MFRLNLLSLPLIVVAFLVFTSDAFAQGVLVDVRIDHPIRLPRPIPMPPRTIPHPPSSYKIDSIEVNAKLTDQVARVQVSQKFENTGSVQMEVGFMFPLPYDGAIDQLTLLVDGKEFQAKLLSKEEAGGDTKRSSARIATRPCWNGSARACSRRTCFRSRRAPSGRSRSATRSCCARARPDRFHLSAEHGQVHVRAGREGEHPAGDRKQAPIKNIYSATHAVNIERPDDKHAIVKYEAKKTVPGEDFRLFFDTGEESVAASVVSYRPEGG